MENGRWRKMKKQGNKRRKGKRRKLHNILAGGGKWELPVMPAHLCTLGEKLNREGLGSKCTIYTPCR